MSETVILTSERENEAPPIGYDAPVEAGVTGLPMEQVLRHHARTIPDFPAITFEEETLSYRAFDRETNRIAKELAAHGVRDRQSVVSGKSVSVRVDIGGRRAIKKKTEKN